MARAPAWLRLAIPAALLVLAQGCATPLAPLDFMQFGPDAAANRQAQTRAFADVSEAELLAAGVFVLQDLGFTIMASDAQLGLVTGIKSRSDRDMLEELRHQALFATATIGLHPAAKMPLADRFAVVLATGAGGEARAHEVRATFYRLWSGPRYTIVVTSPKLYQDFFSMIGATLARSRAGG